MRETRRLKKINVRVAASHVIFLKARWKLSIPPKFQKFRASGTHPRGSWMRWTPMIGHEWPCLVKMVPFSQISSLLNNLKNICQTTNFYMGFQKKNISSRSEKVDFFESYRFLRQCHLKTFNRNASFFAPRTKCQKKLFFGI